MSKIDWGPIKWAVAICVAFFILFYVVLPPVIFPAAIDWHLPVSLSEPADSIKLFTYTDGGTLRDSTAGEARTTAQQYDTTISIADDTTTKAVFRIWYAGVDTFATWTWVHEALATASISAAQMGQIASHSNDTATVYHGSGPWTTGSGSGANAIRIYAIDTSGTDDSVHNVQLTVKTIAGVFDAGLFTNTHGYQDFTLPTGSLIVYGYKVGYTWLPETLNVSTNDTVSISGYNIPATAAPSPNFCRVWNYAIGPAGLISRATITFSVEGDIDTVTCDSLVFVPREVIVYSKEKLPVADSLGYFYADLLYSSCIDDLTYKVTVEKDGHIIKRGSITVPDSTSYKIIW